MNTSFCQLFYRIFLLFSNIFLLSPSYIPPSPDPQIFYILPEITYISSEMSQAISFTRIMTTRPTGGLL